MSKKRRPSNRTKTVKPMNNIGDKIADIRKQKGLSQEALSEQASINLRTLQRIEAGDTEPRGNTLRLLCEALDIVLEDLVDYNKDEDPQYLRWFYFSTLSFLFIPLGNIILPLILWLTNRKKVSGLQAHGTALLNFQIFWSMLSFVLPVAFALMKITFAQDVYANVILIPIIAAGVLYLLNVVLTVIGGIQVGRGRKDPFFPSVVKFIRG